MKRRNFFKKLGCLIAGFAVAPVVIEATKNESGFDVYYDFSKQIPMGHNVYKIPDLTGNNNHIYIKDSPGIINGQIESKEMFELRKSIYRPMADKLVKR